MFIYLVIFLFLAINAFDHVHLHPFLLALSPVSLEHFFPVLTPCLQGFVFPPVTYKINKEYLHMHGYSVIYWITGSSPVAAPLRKNVSSFLGGHELITWGLPPMSLPHPSWNLTGSICADNPWLPLNLQGSGHAVSRRHTIPLHLLSLELFMLPSLMLTDP